MQITFWWTRHVSGFISVRASTPPRMDASLALETLLSETNEQAIATAAKLEQCNKDRQKYTRRLWLKRVRWRCAAWQKYIPAGEGWSPGVRYCRRKIPMNTACRCLCLGKMASLRWFGQKHSGFNVVKGMEQARILSRLVDTRKRVAWRYRSRKILRICASIERYAEEILHDVDLRPTIMITPNFVLGKLLGAGWLAWKFEPFGEGNWPKFYCAMSVVAAMRLKTAKHLRLKISRRP